MNMSAALTILSLTKQIRTAENAMAPAAYQVHRITRLLAQGHHDHSTTAPFNVERLTADLAAFEKKVAAKKRLIAKKQAEIEALAA